MLLLSMHELLSMLFSYRTKFINTFVVVEILNVGVVADPQDVRKFNGVRIKQERSKSSTKICEKVRLVIV